MENEYIPKYNRQAFTTGILDLNNSSNSKYGVKQLFVIVYQNLNFFFLFSFFFFFLVFRI